MLDKNQPLAAKEELTEIQRSYDAQEAHDLMTRADALIRVQHSGNSAKSNTPRTGSSKPTMDQPGLPTQRLSRPRG